MKRNGNNTKPLPSLIAAQLFLVFRDIDNAKRALDAAEEQKRKEDANDKSGSRHS